MASVDGLVSGLDTASIISQLVAADSAPQARLRNNVSAVQLKVTAYQSINAKMSALQTAADNLQKAAAWMPVKATSSSPAVSVSAGASAAPASLSLKVTAVASGRTVTSREAATAEGTLDQLKQSLRVPFDIVKEDGSFVTISPTSGKLSEVTDAINKAESLGLRAVAIRVSDGQYRLQITSTGTGSVNGDFKLVPRSDTDPKSTDLGVTTYPYGTGETFENLVEVTKADGTSAYGTDVSATDAVITIGSQPITVTSQSNTFSELMPGVNVTVSAATDAAVISITRDSDAVAAAMQSLVDAANAALKDIALQSRAGVAGADGKITGGGVLRGDSTLRALKSQILDAVTSAVGSPATSAVTFGLQSTREGELTFDRTKFLEAYAKNPASVQALVSEKSLPALQTGAPARPEGIVERLRAVTVRAVGDLKVSSTTASGTLTAVIEGQKSSVKDLTNRIADWDQKLAQKKERYQKYYAALEVSLGKLQSQSTWLAGQLAGLPSNS